MLVSEQSLPKCRGCPHLPWPCSSSRVGEFHPNGSRLSACLLRFCSPALTPTLPITAVPTGGVQVLKARLAGRASGPLAMSPSPAEPLSWMPPRPDLWPSHWAAPSLGVWLALPLFTTSSSALSPPKTCHWHWTLLLGRLAQSYLLEPFGGPADGAIQRFSRTKAFLASSVFPACKPQWVPTEEQIVFQGELHILSPQQHNLPQPW
jgi:hypothetical protein